MAPSPCVQPYLAGVGASAECIQRWLDTETHVVCLLIHCLHVQVLRFTMTTYLLQSAAKWQPTTTSMLFVLGCLPAQVLQFTMRGVPGHSQVSGKVEFGALRGGLKGFKKMQLAAAAPQGKRPPKQRKVP